MNALHSWWQNLAPREQRGVVLAAAVVLGALYYLLLEEPLRVRREFLRTQVAAEQHDLQQITQFASAARALGEARQRLPLRLPAGQSPIAFVNASAAEHGLGAALRRSVPQGENVAVTLGGAPFDRLAAWLVTLENEHGVVVERAALNRIDKEPGLVTGSVTLSFAP